MPRSWTRSRSRRAPPQAPGRRRSRLSPATSATRGPRHPSPSSLFSSPSSLISNPARRRAVQEPPAMDASCCRPTEAPASHQIDAVPVGSVQPPALDVTAISCIKSPTPCSFRPRQRARRASSLTQPQPRPARPAPAATPPPRIRTSPSPVSPPAAPPRLHHLARVGLVSAPRESSASTAPAASRASALTRSSLRMDA